MPEKSSPPFSILLADTEAQLAQYLQVAQALPQDIAVLSENFEERIRDLCSQVKVLRELAKQGWQSMDWPEEVGNTTYVETNFVEGRDKLAVEPKYVKFGILGDLLTLKCMGAQPQRCRITSNNCTCILIKLPGYMELSVKPKLRPLAQPAQKLEKVALADGNTAWLTPETLKTVRELIAAK